MHYMVHNAFIYIYNTLSKVLAIFVALTETGQWIFSSLHVLHKGLEE